MVKYMTLHTTETGDHANFFEHLFNAYDFYHDMIGMGYPAALYVKDDDTGIYYEKMVSWILGEEAEDNV